MRQPSQVVYRTAVGDMVTMESQIIAVYAASQVDFLKLKDGTVIRLVRLVSVNAEPLRLVSDR